MKDKKMELNPQATEKNHPILSAYIQEALNGRPFEEVLSAISELELSPAQLRERLDRGFMEAVAMQERVLSMGLEVDEETRVHADGVSLLAAYQGWSNKEVLIERGKKEQLISVQDYKARQIISSLNNAELNEDTLLAEAIAGYSKAFDLNITEPRTLLDKAGAKLDSAIDRARNNAHVRGATAAATVLIASTAVSLVTAGSAAAEVKSTNVTPTTPSSDNEIKKGHLVKVKAKKVQPQAPGVISPQPDAQPKIDTISTNQKRTARATEAATEAKVTKETEKVKKPIITISRKGVVAATPPESKVIDEAGDKEKKKGNVIRIKPIPVVPAPAPEAAPAPATPNPETPAAPGQASYQLNDEQNGLIDSLNLRASQKDFLKQVTAGAIGLQQRGAKVNPEVVIAQAVLESGWGGSELTKVANNYFGMKAGTTWEGKTVVMPTKEFINGSWVTVDAKWQAFDSAEDCFAEYEKFIGERAHFADALQHSDNPEEYVKALVNGDLKYATDPTYVQKIMSTVKANHLSKIVDIANNLQAEKSAEAKAATEEKAAADAKAAEDAKAAAEAENNATRASQTKKEVEPFTEWKDPVPEESRKSPQYAGHKGLDYAVKAGTPFFAAAGGTVQVLTYDVTDQQFCKDAFSKIGKSMDVIKDPIQKEVRITRMIGDDKYVVIYAHMSEIGVKDGEIVSAGQQIGKTGNSGCSTGDHAHFEIRKNGVSIDPNAVLNGDSWRTMSSITESAQEEHTHAVDGQEEDHMNESSLHQHSVSDAPTVIDGSPDPDEISQISEKSVDNTLTDDQKRRLAAIKQVAELKKRMAAAAEQKSDAVAGEGYLSVRR